MKLPPRLAELVDELASLETREDKYEQLLFLADSVELGKPKMAAINKVHACVSEVFIDATLRDGKVYFSGTSNALLVKGLVAILVQGLSGLTPKQILSVKSDFLGKLGLADTLSPSRMSASYNIFELMQKKAKELSH